MCVLHLFPLPPLPPPRHHSFSSFPVVLALLPAVHPIILRLCYSSFLALHSSLAPPFVFTFFLFIAFILHLLPFLSYPLPRLGFSLLSLLYLIFFLLHTPAMSTVSSPLYFTLISATIAHFPRTRLSSGAFFFLFLLLFPLLTQREKKREGTGIKRPRENKCKFLSSFLFTHNFTLRISQKFEEFSSPIVASSPLKLSRGGEER